MIVSFRLGLCALAMTGIAAADTWTGTLVDVMCKGRDLANHTRECALSCSKGGYGLVLSDGRFLKFDERGNVQALGALKRSSKEKDLKAKVSGSAKGDVIHVESIEMQ